MGQTNKQTSKNKQANKQKQTNKQAKTNKQTSKQTSIHLVELFKFNPADRGRLSLKQCLASTTDLADEVAQHSTACSGETEKATTFSNRPCHRCLAA